MTSSEQLPEVLIENRYPEEYKKHLGAYEQEFTKKYQFIKESNAKKVELRAYQDILDDCFWTQKQNFMKNCRTIALEYLELLKYPNQHKMRHDASSLTNTSCSEHRSGQVRSID
ncbi:hypothetical protein SAMD00019534_016880 [Acytostelium subglobosum LB1]|uniref:hypothetical protein n=1 Tax=Acytostelium subglobosum LB1 TaxID=1410327 RepID=UPI000644CC39|nr:hypothetical protein SAMD00019534_016880 [Acytostelium subglobosum LB1]GAM18513.1 hypothetical protein SAMD00019534_016880 [Acytostelium subglobosum LB1]|eukprot:XP_012757733.1 hypothetical protein SAMD00019534_016880 [Acytostelium subglobosum LB1]